MVAGRIHDPLRVEPRRCLGHLSNRRGWRGLRRITAGQNAAAPRFSPDGTTIAFHSDRNGTDYDIYLIDADGTNERILIDGPGDQRLPEWSPEGTRIAYVSNAGGHHDAFIHDLSTGASVQITRQPEDELFTVLETRGVGAARSAVRIARASIPPIRVFRDSRTAAQHIGWRARDGRLDEARFLLKTGLLEFPDDHGLLALQDSLPADR